MKNGLSGLLEIVKQGQSVIVEDRGVAVARLVPVSTSTDLGDDRGRLAGLERLGIVHPPQSSEPSLVLLGQAPPLTNRRIRLSDIVISERAEGR